MKTAREDGDFRAAVQIHARAVNNICDICTERADGEV